jgi:hypothetical protein
MMDQKITLHGTFNGKAHSVELYYSCEDPDCVGWDILRWDPDRFNADKAIIAQNGWSMDDSQLFQRP